MIPDCDTYLKSLATFLAEDLAPKIVDDYARSEILRHTMLLGAASEESQRAAAWRHAENVALSSLLARLADFLDDEVLSARLRTENSTRDDDLHVASLATTNRRLRSLLVQAHAILEGVDTPASRALEDELWSELRASTERRRKATDRF